MEDETDSIVKRAHIAKGDTPGKSNPKYGRVTEDESGNKPLPQRRRSLFKNEDVLPTETLVAHSVKAANWKNEELEAIVQYIALYKPNFDDDHWPAIRDGAFWEQCAKAVHQYTGQPLRTGTLYIVYRVDWNLVNMVTNRPKKFGCIIMVTILTM